MGRYSFEEGIPTPPRSGSRPRRVNGRSFTPTPSTSHPPNNGFNFGMCSTTPTGTSNCFNCWNCGAHNPAPEAHNNAAFSSVSLRDSNVPPKLRDLENEAFPPSSSQASIQSNATPNSSFVPFSIGKTAAVDPAINEIKFDWTLSSTADDRSVRFSDVSDKPRFSFTGTTPSSKAPSFVTGVASSGNSSVQDRKATPHPSKSTRPSVSSSSSPGLPKSLDYAEKPAAAKDSTPLNIPLGGDWNSHKKKSKNDEPPKTTPRPSSTVASAAMADAFSFSSLRSSVDVGNKSNEPPKTAPRPSSTALGSTPLSVDAGKKSNEPPKTAPRPSSTDFGWIQSSVDVAKKDANTRTPVPVVRRKPWQPLKSGGALVPRLGSGIKSHKVASGTSLIGPSPNKLPAFKFEASASSAITDTAATNLAKPNDTNRLILKAKRVGPVPQAAALPTEVNERAVLASKKRRPASQNPLEGSFDFSLTKPADEATVEVRDETSHVNAAEGPTQNQAVSGWGNTFDSLENTWKCNVCYCHNDEDLTSCAACETSRPGQASAAVFSSTNTTAATSAVFSFGAPSSTNASAGGTFEHTDEATSGPKLVATQSAENEAAPAPLKKISAGDVYPPLSPKAPSAVPLICKTLALAPTPKKKVDSSESSPQEASVHSESPVPAKESGKSDGNAEDKSRILVAVSGNVEVSPEALRTPAKSTARNRAATTPKPTTPRVQDKEGVMTRSMRKKNARVTRSMSKK